MVESDDDLFAAGNCYDAGEFKDYDLFCPYAYRLPVSPTGSSHTGSSSRIIVKDLSVEYKYLGADSEFFYEARLKAARKLTRGFNTSIGQRNYSCIGIRLTRSPPVSEARQHAAPLTAS